MHQRTYFLRLWSGHRSDGLDSNTLLVSLWPPCPTFAWFRVSNSKIVLQSQIELLEVTLAIVSDTRMETLKLLCVDARINENKWTQLPIMKLHVDSRQPLFQIRI